MNRRYSSEEVEDEEEDIVVAMCEGRRKHKHATFQAPHSTVAVSVTLPKKGEPKHAPKIRQRHTDARARDLVSDMASDAPGDAPGDAPSDDDDVAGDFVGDTEPIRPETLVEALELKSDELTESEIRTLKVLAKSHLKPSTAKRVKALLAEVKGFW